MQKTISMHLNRIHFEWAFGVHRTYIYTLYFFKEREKEQRLANLKIVQFVSTK